MGSQRRETRIGLLVGAHLLFGLIMALIAVNARRLSNSNCASILYMGLLSSNILLVGMWVGLSASRWWIKLLGLLGGLGWLGFLSLAPVPVRNEFLPILALVASPLLVVAGSCVVCRRFLARIEHRTFWEPRPISEELRFTLRTIIALTIATSRP